jgi:asparaginyl-tRNA synthetase
MEIVQVIKDYKKYLDKDIEVSGWIKNNRDQKDFGFIDLSDGTCFKHLQVVYDASLNNFNDVSKYLVGSTINVKGKLVKSTGKQDFELKAEEIILLGNCPEDYPIQPKRHTKEFLREQAHLRPRTNIFQAVFRVRSLAAFAIHEYFQKNGYIYVNTPILTASDCEGAGEMFQVTTLDLERIAKEGKVDYSKDFFGKRTGLTVSGQLEAENYATAFSKVYTFGPTFRAENSNTKTHMNEFWMIEPEIAFCDLEKLMDIEEEFIKYIIKYCLDNASDEIEFLDQYAEKGLKEKLETVLKSKFTRIDHKDVITILKKAPIKWEFEPQYGEDIAKEHERYITEYFHGPVFIKNWPKDIKAFYMKQNEDKETVAAVDLELPNIGEIIGGSQREESFEKLNKRMDELKMNKNELSWYLDLRKYGTCVHSGFGLGFERVIMYLTGMENIRDVIPFPRTPGNCDF